MCYGDDARPPDLPYPPVSGGSGDTGGGVAARREFRLRSDDGTEFMAYGARAAAASGTGVVVLPDIRGLHSFYKELADRFAEAGFDAVAFDYFGRTAETDNRDETFAFRPHVDQTRPETVAADVSAAIAYLRSVEGGAVERVFTVGFCFGGAHSWRQAAVQPDLAGAIGFYGVPARVRDVIPEMKAPLLVLVAGEDFTPLEEFEAFDRELTEAGVEHTMVVYEGAPHSFFDRTFEEHAEASADAWRQMVRFMS